MKIERFKNVWDAFESDAGERERLKTRSELMDALRDRIESWKVTRREAAKRLDVMQPRLNDLLEGRFNKFNLRASDLAARAGLSIKATSRTGSTVDSLWAELGILADVQKLAT